MKTTFLVVALLAPCAHAMNVKDVPVKCTAPDGKVTYQTGSCPPGHQIAVARNDTAPQARKDDWNFSRQFDDMTNARTCIASSPDFYIPGRREYHQARIVITLQKSAEPLVFLVAMGKSAVFHHNISGTGLKVGDAAMIPFGSRPSQTVLAMPAGTNAPIIESMQSYKSVKVRTRIWPWDNTLDSHDVPLNGFMRAYTLAQQCAVSL